jgi:hypothetical protein
MSIFITYAVKHQGQHCEENGYKLVSFLFKKQENHEIYETKTLLTKHIGWL